MDEHTPRAAGLAAGLIIAVVAMLYWFWGETDQIGLVTGDATSYLTMAAAYADPKADPIKTEAAAQSRFPPLYPLLLARLGAATDLVRAHQITLTCLLLGLIVLHGWLRREGLGALPSALYVAAAASIPDIWLAALSIQSEYLYVLLSVSALVLLTAAERGRDRKLLCAAALIISLAVLARSAGIALFVPLLAVLRARPWRDRLLALAIATGPVAIWYGLHQARHGYASALGTTLAQWLATDPGGFFRQQILALRHGLELAMAPQPAWLAAFVDAWGVLCLLGVVIRAAKLRPDALYLLAYLFVLLLWPYPGDSHRLIWPALPVLMIQPALAFAPDVRFRHTASVLTAAVLLALSGPSILRAEQRYRDPLAVEIAHARTNPIWYSPPPEAATRFVLAESLLVQALEKLPRFVGEHECVLSTRPEWIVYFADRRSEAPPIAEAPVASMEAALKRCPYVLMTPFNDRGFPDPMYPIARLPAGVQLLDYTYAADPSAPGKRIEFLLVRSDARD